MLNQLFFVIFVRLSQVKLLNTKNLTLYTANDTTRTTNSNLT
jgi:hypothetical protein